MLYWSPSFSFFCNWESKKVRRRRRRRRKRRRGRGGGRAWSSRANLQVQNWVLKLENSSLEFKIESSNWKLNHYVQNWYPEFKSESSNSKNPKKPEVEKLKSGVREWIIKSKNWTLKLKIKAWNSRPNLGWQMQSRSFFELKWWIQMNFWNIFCKHNSQKKLNWFLHDFWKRKQCCIYQPNLTGKTFSFFFNYFFLRTEPRTSPQKKVSWKINEHFFHQFRLINAASNIFSNIASKSI